MRRAAPVQEHDRLEGDEGRGHIDISYETGYGCEVGEQRYLARSTYEVAQVGSLHGSDGGLFTVRKKFSIVKTDGCKMPWLRITGLRRM